MSEVDINVMAPIIGQTYTTIRGTFTVLTWDIEKYSVLLRLNDNRHLLAAQSDWLTWQLSLRSTG